MNPPDAPKAARKPKVHKKAAQPVKHHRLQSLEEMAAEKDRISSRGGNDEPYFSKHCSSQFVFWQKNAEQGNSIAQLLLGNCYGYGFGVQKDYAEAVAWFRKAAEQGHATAQNELGERYHNGEGVEKNEGTAVAWYRKAAKQGNENAKQKLKELGL